MGDESRHLDLTPINRLERLVNKALFADVTFRVGESGELMFGHKAILAEASEVFRAQFSGGFRESRDNVRDVEISVVGIEPAIFKELLRYMYCNRVSVTMDNVVHIFYAANKYLLTQLKKICEAFLVANLSERNVLGLFDSNRRFELEEINQVCLDIICGNPIKLFADKSFLTLARKSVELIATRQFINCQTTQLLTAIGQWIKINMDDGSKDAVMILSLVRELKNRDFKCKKMHNFSAGHYVYSTKTSQITVATEADNKFPLLRSHLRPPLPTPRTTQMIPLTKIQPAKVFFDLHISSNFQFSIYGFGICIKSQHVLKPITLEVTATARNESGVLIGDIFVTKRSVTPCDKFCVEEILFEKLTIGKASTCTITVETEHGLEPLFCFKNFEPELHILGLQISSCYGVRYKVPPQPSTNSIVSYLLYDTVCMNKFALFS